jgi:chromosomal replication initiator protein
MNIFDGTNSDLAYLNTLMSFDNFVIGKANQLAHAAAVQVVESPKAIYNPLFIYGGTGLGKTHLLQAIGNQFKSKTPVARIRYVHSTEYLSDVVRAFQTKQFDDFKELYFSLDLLLVDDIQFITDKPGTQQEFLLLLNLLVSNNKPVVITCNSAPHDIAGMNLHLTSRLSGGLTVVIEPPNLEMRVAMLLKRSAHMNIPIGEEVARFLGKNVRQYICDDVRQLEGVLHGIVTFAQFHKRNITVQLAKEVLSAHDYYSGPGFTDNSLRGFLK